MSNGNDKATQEKTEPQNTRYHQISEVLEAHRGERHIVVAHDYPDPDAISTAFAHRLVSAQFDIETEIVYSGEISHQQNIALIRLLNIEPTHYDSSMDLQPFDGAVYVDNQGTASAEIMEALEQAGVPALIVVDHHEQQDRLKPEFSDIRRVGSTATIYAEYLEDGLVEMDEDKDEHRVVATALMHGLLTDTDRFLQADAKDFKAASFLSQFSDSDLLIQIMSQARSRQTMDVIHRALENRIIVENFSISGVKYLRAEDRDAIPQAADFLLTEENVHTAIVYGIIRNEAGEEKMSGSLRTSKITLDPDKFIKDVFGKDAEGYYFGGGKELAGAYEIPIGFLSGENDDEYSESKWRVFDDQTKQKIFHEIGVDYESSE
jgi:nanoRNase/pAp phosphatase (c-di-AMP/oligoRNAs hydrolase)